MKVSGWLAVVVLGAAGTACQTPHVRTDELSTEPIAIQYREPTLSRKRADALEEGQEDPNRAIELKKIGEYVSDLFRGDAPKENREFLGRLALLDPRTGTVELIEASLRGAVPQDWTPDHRRLMFAQRRGRDLQLMEFDRDTRSVRPLSGGTWAHPRGCYLADGRMLFMRVVGATRRGKKTVNTQIVLTDERGRNEEPVSESEIVHSPACAPDGGAIAYVEVDHGLIEHIITHVPPTTGVPRRIAPGRHPAFTADGKWIVYSARSHDQWKLYRIRPDGTGRAPLGRGLFDEEKPRVSPDGRVVVFVVKEGVRPWLYVRRFDGTGDRMFFKNGDADYPIW